MPDYAGPLQRLVLSRTLWLIVAWPILGLAWQVLVARSRIARATTDVARKRELASARTAGIACIGLATVSTLAHAAVLSRTAGASRALLQHIASGAREGCLDAPIDLLFDPLSATFCSLACLVALAAAVISATGPAGGAPATRQAPERLATTPPSLPRRIPQGALAQAPGWVTWAWLQLSLGGALVAFLADGFVGTAMGWALAGGAAAWLAGSPVAPATSTRGIAQAVRSAAGVCVMLVGAALLFWGHGGAWDGDDYVPDLQPRFALVRAGVSPAADAGSPGASLTLTSVPGAAVFLDDARTPMSRAPFVGIPVPAGVHSLRIRVPDGLADEVLGRVAFVPGEELSLLPFGPTLVFRVMADQLIVRGPGDDRAARRDIEARAGPGGTAAVAASLLLFLLAAWAMSGGSPPTLAPRALGALGCAATTAMLGPYLLARLAFLFPLTPYTWAAVEAIGAATLLLAGWSAPVYTGVRRWLAFAGVAPASLTWLALGAAGVTAATYVAIASGVGTAALYLAAALVPGRRPRDAEAPETLGALLLVRGPARLGTLLAGMDRWVIAPIAAAIGALVRAAGWSLAVIDEHVVAAPANGIALRILAAERRVEPIVGASMAAVAWVLLTAAGVAGLAYAFWPGR